MNRKALLVLLSACVIAGAAGQTAQNAPRQKVQPKPIGDRRNDRGPRQDNRQSERTGERQPERTGERAGKPSGGGQNRRRRFGKGSGGGGNGGGGNFQRRSRG